MFGPAMDGGGSIAPADDAADRDDGDIDHQVLAVARVPRVAEGFEVRADRADVDELRHGRRPGIWRRRPPRTGRRYAAKRSPRPTPRIARRWASRQITQASQLCALAVVLRRLRLRR